MAELLRMPSPVLVHPRRRNGSGYISRVPLTWRGETFLLTGGSLPLTAEERGRRRRMLGASVGLQVVLAILFAAELAIGPPLPPPPETPPPEIQLLAPVSPWALPVPVRPPKPATHHYLRLRPSPPPPVAKQIHPELVRTPAAQAPDVRMALPALPLAAPVPPMPPPDVRTGEFGAPHGLTPAKVVTVPLPVLGKFGSSRAVADPPDPPASGPIGWAGFDAPAPAGAVTAPVVAPHPSGFEDANPEAAAAAPRPAHLQLHTFGAPAPIAPSSTAPAARPAPMLEPPQVLSWPKPLYTRAAARHEIQGEVVLQVRLRAQGGVQILRVVRGLGYGLDQSAIVAARQLQFRPARDHGRPVDWIVLLHVQFRLAN